MSSNKKDQYCARYDEEGMSEFLNQLIDTECIEGAALGITKLVIDKGISSLTENQRAVFEKYVMDEYYVEECSRCGDNIPWSEMDQARESEMCGWCAHMHEKMMNE